MYKSQLNKLFKKVYTNIGMLNELFLKTYLKNFLKKDKQLMWKNCEHKLFKTFESKSSENLSRNRKGCGKNILRASPKNSVKCCGQVKFQKIF